MTLRVIDADWPAPPTVRAVATERTGGISVGSYHSLNLAAHVGDDAHHVAENRQRLKSVLGLAAEPSWLEQIHGSTVLDLDQAPAGPADGAVTRQAGVVCAVLTADCLPVTLCDRTGRRVGVAHAGWRGLLAGVLGAAVQAMQTRPDGILAWLGPSIGAGAYEVGEEVRATFVAADPGDRVCFEPNEHGRWQADLQGLARRSLARAGVQAVYGGGWCTFSQRERFFSHRREAPCGRMATLIWLEE